MSKIRRCDHTLKKRRFLVFMALNSEAVSDSNVSTISDTFIKLHGHRRRKILKAGGGTKDMAV